MNILYGSIKNLWGCQILEIGLGSWVTVSFTISALPYTYGYMYVYVCVCVITEKFPWTLKYQSESGFSAFLLGNI